MSLLRSRLSSLSLRAKLSLANGLLALVAATGLTALCWWMLAGDVRHGIAEAQQAMAASVARQLDERVQIRREALVMAAAVLGQQPGLPDADELERHFASRPTVRSLFDVLFVADAHGRIVFDAPQLPGRRGGSIAERDYFAEVMAKGEPVISRPFAAKTSKQPGIAFAVPLHAPDGRRIGMLGGTLFLNRPNFLGEVGAARIGQQGHFVLLVKGAKPVVLMHPRTELLLGPPVDVGTPAQQQAAFSGAEGTVEGATGTGTRALLTYQSLSAAPWMLVAVYPTHEAFAALEEHERGVLAGGLATALLAGWAMWALVSRLLRPLQALRLAIESPAGQPEAVLPRAASASRELAAVVRAYTGMRERQAAAQEALRLSEQRLRTIADHLPATIAYMDAQGRYRFSNAQYRSLYGIDPQKMIGKSTLEVFGPQNREALQAPVEAALRGERGRFEREIDHGGRTLHMSIDYVPDVVDGQVQGVYVMAQDITARWQAQLQRELSEARLHASEQRLRTITDHMPALISHLDAELRYRFCNKTMYEWTGTTPDAVIGRTLKEAFGDALYEARRSQLERALGGEQVEFEIELLMQGVRRVLHSVYVPDRDADGQVMGVYTMAFDVTAQKDVEAQLHALARFDTLTGLPNRRQLDERLTEAMARCRRTGRPMALMFLDLDRFKSINDNHGHAGGDAVLRQFAQRLVACVRATDTVARLAGDEFVVILEGLNTGEEAQFVARKIVAAVRRPFEVDGQPVPSSTSVGIGYYGGDALLTPDELMAKADQALYQVKGAGRNAYRLVVC
jgi:diguanylate cyclase (GGDEF)-like protein/PAS domain S-box-containing protein